MHYSWRDFIQLNLDKDQNTPERIQQVEASLDLIENTKMGQQMLQDLGKVQKDFFKGHKTLITQWAEPKHNNSSQFSYSKQDQTVFLDPYTDLILHKDQTIAAVPMEYMLFHELTHASHYALHKEAFDHGKKLSEWQVEGYATKQTDLYTKERGDIAGLRQSYVNALGTMETTKYTVGGKVVKAEEYLSGLGVEKGKPLTHDQIAQIYKDIFSVNFKNEPIFEREFLQAFLPERTDLLAQVKSAELVLKLPVAQVEDHVSHSPGNVGNMNHKVVSKAPHH